MRVECALGRAAAVARDHAHAQSHRLMPVIHRSERGRRASIHLASASRAEGLPSAGVRSHHAGLASERLAVGCTVRCRRARCSRCTRATTRRPSRPATRNMTSSTFPAAPGSAGSSGMTRSRSTSRSSSRKLLANMTAAVIEQNIQTLERFAGRGSPSGAAFSTGGDPRQRRRNVRQHRAAAAAELSVVTEEHQRAAVSHLGDLAGTPGALLPAATLHPSEPQP